jgi:hypothetical protein
MDPVSRSAVRLAIVQKDGSLIRQFTLLIIIQPGCHCSVSIQQLTAGNAINLWYSKKLKQTALIAIMICIRAL